MHWLAAATPVASRFQLLVAFPALLVNWVMVRSVSVTPPCLLLSSACRIALLPTARGVAVLWLVSKASMYMTDGAHITNKSYSRDHTVPVRCRFNWHIRILAYFFWRPRVWRQFKLHCLCDWPEWRRQHLHLKQHLCHTVCERSVDRWFVLRGCLLVFRAAFLDTLCRLYECCTGT